MKGVYICSILSLVGVLCTSRPALGSDQPYDNQEVQPYDNQNYKPYEIQNEQPYEKQNKQPYNKQYDQPYNKQYDQPYNKPDDKPYNEQYDQLYYLPYMKDVPEQVYFRTEKIEPFVLECGLGSENEDNVKYRWTKDGEPFDFESVDNVYQPNKNQGTIIFTKPKKEDEGDYRCYADTEYGTASTPIIKTRRAYINKPNYEIRSYKPVEGSPYTLECPVPDAYPKPEIEWRYQLANDKNEYNVINNNKLVTVGPNGELFFNKIGQEYVTNNRYRYVCLARTPASDEPVYLAEHNIVGLEKNPEGDKPEMIEQFISPDVVAKVGERIYLYCIYGGDLETSPDWFKDGENVNNNPGDRTTKYDGTDGRRYVIREVRTEDEGQYSCQVNNENLGLEQINYIKLTVLDEPKFVEKSEKYITSNEGAAELNIPCRVTGIPKPYREMTYNSQPIEKIIKPGENRIEVNENGITIRNLIPSDAGYYGCSAYNDLGQKYTEVLVSIK